MTENYLLILVGVAAGALCVILICFDQRRQRARFKRFAQRSSTDFNAWYQENFSSKPDVNPEEVKMVGEVIAEALAIPLVKLRSTDRLSHELGMPGIDCVVGQESDSDLPEIVFAACFMSGIFDRLEGRQEKGDKNPDDGDHHQKFDQRESWAFWRGHGFQSNKMG